MSDIFISHVEEDEGIAQEIARGLESAGYTTWYYERDGVPGLSYLVQTGQAIEKSKAFVLVISRDSLGSKQITKEVDRAHECGKPFIPLLRDVTHVEFQNRQPEWRQAIGTATSIRIPPEGISAILPRIVKGLKALGIDSGSTSQQPPPPPLPDGDPVINELTKKIQQDPENPLLYNDRGIA